MNFANITKIFLTLKLIYKKELLIAFLSGTCMGLAAEPLGWWLFAWVALVPLWIFAVKLDQKTFILSAFAWGIGYHGLALFWITGIHPMTWLGVPWVASLFIALFCWSFITLWGTAIVVIWAFLLKKLTLLIDKQANESLIITSRILIGTVLWCSLESFWSQGDLQWSYIAYTQSFHNLVILHLGQISGPMTVTAAVIIVNALIAEVWLKTNQQKHQKLNLKLRLYFLPIVVFIIFHLIGFSLYNRPLNDSAEQAFKIGIIQGNIPNEIKLNPMGWRRALQGYTTGYQTLAEQGVDVVLTPETALPFLWTEQNRQSSTFYQAILDKKVPAWVGSLGLTQGGMTNSLFTVDGDGTILSQYDKVNLVPLGEYIPFDTVLGKLINRLSPLDSRLIHGKPNQQFNTPFGQGIVGICYDSTYAEHFRRQAATGGEFILTASNDAHYAEGMLAQHHAQDTMRAIETDRWTARATNTGYSGIIDPKGKTVWISGINTYEIHTDILYRRQTQTLYVRWGDWLTPVLWILGAITTGLTHFNTVNKGNLKSN